MPTVRVEVSALPPRYVVRARVKSGLDFLNWIQKNIDKPGKYVLCAADASAIHDCGHLDKIFEQRAAGEQEIGFQIRRLSDFDGGHLRIRELWPDPEKLPCLEYCREILGDKFDEEIEAPQNAKSPAELHEEARAMSMIQTSTASGGGREEDRITQVPGFGYLIKERAKAPVRDPLKRDDVEFWRLLGTKEEPWDVMEVRGRRMLVAFLSGEVDLAVQLFMDGRVDCSARDSINSSLLHWSIYYELQPVCAKLIEYHADVDQKNDLSETPLMIACQEGCWGIFEFLFDKVDKDPGTIPGDLDCQDLERGQTALLWCARHGHLPAVQKLVALGVDLNRADFDGTTALHIATVYNDVPMVSLLLKSNSNPDCRSHVWKTPMKIALEYGYSEIVDKLYDAGATPGTPDRQGTGILDDHYAVWEPMPPALDLAARGLMPE
mmetsp:Transcript_1131/g.2449  ORF Transcript_1131/g.2449 Transcript_1131/m.2449 type:complete len:436 (+) Transcript_1131:142-1449(+)|eukprot:g9940.t1